MDPDQFKIAKLTKRVAKHVLHNDEDAENVSQEVLVTVWRNQERIDEPLKYASTLAYRVAVRYKIRRDRQPLCAANGIDAADPNNFVHDIVNRLFVEDMLDNLPPQQAKALDARYLMDMSVDEVATFLDVSVNTAKTHLKLGLRNARYWWFGANADSNDERGN